RDLHSFPTRRSSDLKEFNVLCDFVKNQHIPFISLNQHEDKKVNNEQIILIKAKENKGFAHGNNIALQFALKQNNANYFWILNNRSEEHTSELQSREN